MRYLPLVVLMAFGCEPGVMGEKPASGEEVVDTGTAPADTDVPADDTDLPADTDTAEPVVDDTGDAPIDDTDEPADTGETDGCGELTTQCDGSVVSWCEDGTAESYDCADAGLTCGRNDEGVAECVPVVTDADGDGYAVGDDCDDSDASVNARRSYYDDLDRDGYGGTSLGTACDNARTDVATVGGDCDDADAAINPDATEIADDGADNDCDGVSLETEDEPVDTAVDPSETDDDRDGVSVEDGDCDDANDDVYPGATEACNEVDDDCDGSTDEGVSTAYWPDVDGDGYGDDDSVSYWGCTGSSGYVTNSNDCDDADASVNPGETDVAGDGIDQDCDGSDAGAACEDGAAACFVDVDEDGNYETLLMDAGQWTLPELEDADADIYENGYGTECGIDGDNVEANSSGYYVISFDGLSSCTTQVSLTAESGSTTYWWQNYAFCTDGSDSQGICESTGGGTYLIGIDWRASSGLRF